MKRGECGRTPVEPHCSGSPETVNESLAPGPGSKVEVTATERGGRLWGHGEQLTVSPMLFTGTLLEAALPHLREYGPGGLTLVSTLVAVYRFSLWA